MTSAIGTGSPIGSRSTGLTCGAAADLEQFRTAKAVTQAMTNAEGTDVHAGRVDEAEEHARKSHALADELRNPSGRVFGVALLACLAVERGE